MKAAFLRFSWGLVIILLDIRFGLFDILIDAVGWAMIWSALHQLSVSRPKYAKAIPFAVLLFLFSINEVFPLIQLTTNNIGPSVSMLLYSSAVVLLMWLLAETFLQEVLSHALEANQTTLAQSVQSARTFFRVISVGTLVYLPFSLNMTGSQPSLLTILIPSLGIIAQLVLVFTCRRAAHLFAERLPSH